MAFRFNPITGQLDLVNTTTSPGGGVTGIAPTTPGAIARWVDTMGTVIENSPGTIVQDSGAIEAQGFVFDREIINDIIVPNHYTMINTDVELISGDIILDGDAQLLLL